MRCKQCGQELSRGQTVCPACGTPVKKRGNKTLLSVLLVFLFVVIVSGVLIFLNLQGRGELPELSFSTIKSLFVRDGEKAPEPEAAEPTEEPEAAEEPEVSAEPEAAEEPEVNAEPEAAEEPEVVETIAEAEPTDDPDALSALEAYQALERRSFALLAESWAACRTADADAADKLLRGDGPLLLRLLLNMTLDAEAQAQLTIGGADAVEAESWVLFAAEAKDDESDPNAPFRALLASGESDALLADYLDLVLSGIDEVALSQGTLEAEGVVERCPSCFEVDLDAATLQRIASSVIGALRWDKRIDGILGEEDYAAFLDRLDELEYALDTGAWDSALHMALYADENGRLRGRSLSFGPDGSDRVLLALPRNGEDLGLELSLRDGSGLRALSGRGTQAEDGFSGCFRLLQDGKSVARLTVETAG